MFRVRTDERVFAQKVHDAAYALRRLLDNVDSLWTENGLPVRFCNAQALRDIFMRLFLC